MDSVINGKTKYIIEDDEPNNDLVKELVWQAGDLTARFGKIEAAIEKLLQALKINPLYAPAHNDLGVAYWQLANIKKAKEHIIKAYELEPDNSIYLLNIFDILLSECKYDEAEEYCMGYLTRHPANAEVNEAISNYYIVIKGKTFIPHENIESNYIKEKLESIGSFVNFLDGKEIPQYPLDMYLEISNVCDLKCVMCGVFSAVNPSRHGNFTDLKMGFLDYNTLTPIVSLLKHALRVHCFGYGEPTIHPKFFEVIKYVTNFEVIVDFFTNGMHFTDELIELVVDRGVHTITVSFSGATKEEYENVYQGSNFEKVIDGIARLSKYKKSKGRVYPRIEINSLAFQHHLYKFDQFTEIMGSAGVTQINLKPLMEWAESMPSLKGHSALITPEINNTVIARALKIARKYGVHLCLSSELFAENEEKEKEKLLILSCLTKEEFESKKDFIPVTRFKEIAKTIIPIKKQAIGWRDADKNDFPMMQVDEINEILNVSETESSKDKDGYFHCMEPFKVMYIMNNGQTKPCCNVPNYIPALGNVNNHNGETVWRGNGFKAYRDAIFSNKYPNNCEYCLKLKNGPRSHNFDDLFIDYSKWFGNLFSSKFPDRSEIDLKNNGNCTSLCEGI